MISSRALSLDKVLLTIKNALTMSKLEQENRALRQESSANMKL